MIVVLETILFHSWKNFKGVQRAYNVWYKIKKIMKNDMFVRLVSPPTFVPKHMCYIGFLMFLFKLGI
jgi:hypothetical protein